MKLQNKLILAALALVLLPVLILCISLAGLNAYQSRQLKEEYGIDGDVDLLNFNINMVFDAQMRHVDEALTKARTRDPYALEDIGFLADLNDQLTGKNSYLMAEKNGEFFFNGTEGNESLQQFLVKKEIIADKERLYYSSDTQYLIGSFDFLTKNGAVGALYLVTKVSEQPPQIRQSIYSVGFIVVIGLIITALLLASWLQNSMVAPVRKLQKATRAIKEGNLDYELEIEGGDEISDLCRDFEDMRKRLKDNAAESLQYEQDNKVLISNISHDLKTPLTAIKGYVEGIMDGVASSPEKLDKYIRTIYNKANDMDTLVDELTLYAKIDTNRIPYNFSRISVKEYFADCADELKTELEARGIELGYMNLLQEDVSVIADTEQLKRVINNIVSNSVKYMDKKQGIINIRVRDENDFIRVELEDNGRGIAARDLPYIFDRFYRTDASRNSRTGGSGIGLSIVRKIIEDHGGRIWAMSREGAGTTMCFELRKYQEVEHEQDSDH